MRWRRWGQRAGDEASERESGDVAQRASRTRDLDVLKAALEGLQGENQRLRDARASVTRQLGPLPISAALITGLVSAFPGSHSRSTAQKWLTGVALGAFALMVYASVRSSALMPYRKLRDKHEEAKPNGAAFDDDNAGRPDDDNHWTAAPGSPESIVDEVLKRVESRSKVCAEERWYASMIRLERRIRGRATPRKWYESLGWFLWPGKATTLQQGFDREWRALFIVKMLFVVVVALLVAARLS